MHHQQQYQQQQQHSSSFGGYREVSSEDFVETTTTTTTILSAALHHTATTAATPSTPTPYSRPTKYTNKSRRYDVDWLSILIFVFVAVAFLFHLIAMGAPYWATTYDKHFPNRRVEHIGLWKYCVDPIVSVNDGTRGVRYGDSSRQICDDFVNIIYSDWLKAAQSFMILSFFTFLPTVGCVAMALLVANLMFNAVAIAGMFTCGFFQFITVVIFGHYYENYFDSKDAAWKGKSGAYLGWTFVVAVFGMAACFCCTAVLMLKLVEEKRGKRIDWGLVNPMHQESKKLLI